MNNLSDNNLCTFQTFQTSLEIIQAMQKNQARSLSDMLIIWGHECFDDSLRFTCPGEGKFASKILLKLKTTLRSKYWKVLYKDNFGDKFYWVCLWRMKQSLRSRDGVRRRRYLTLFENLENSERNISLEVANQERIKSIIQTEMEVAQK